MQFIRRQPDRDRPWRAWLFAVAELGGSAAERWLGCPSHARRMSAASPLRPAMLLTGYSSAQRARGAGSLSRVPDRRRQVKILSMAGFTYDEIGAMLGLSYTRVNALATEANKWLRTERRLGTNSGPK